MPISPPIKGPSRDPLRDWFPIAKIHEGRWSLLLRAKPASAAKADPADFALRMLRAPARPGTFAYRRLQQQVNVSHAVRHPALPPVADFELHGAHPFTITPYVAGFSAASWRNAGKRCPIGVACWITRQVAQAVKALHDTGVRHGGLSPANIVVSQVGHATVLGLGNAVPLGSASIGDELAIKAAYAAPEQFRPGAEAIAASDVYSLGAILYELIARQPPFVVRSEAEYGAMHSLAPIPDLRLVAPEGPYALSALIRRMLTKEPLRRPAIEEIVSQLSDFEIASFHDWASVA
jgi:eukaryotic-like serine/threonine-protein kinase